MTKRLIIKELIPELYQTMLQLSEFVAESGINKLHQELIKIRASQINGCAFCMSKHTVEALKYGEDPKRLYILSAWKETTDYFSAEDQAILKLTEEITLIADYGLSNRTYDEAVTLFGEEMTAKLIVAIVNINALNRFSVSQRLHPLT